MSDRNKSGTDLSRTAANILSMAGYSAAGNTERKDGCFRWFSKDGRSFLVIEDGETVAILEVLGTSSDGSKMLDGLRERIGSVKREPALTAFTHSMQSQKMRAPGKSK